MSKQSTIKKTNAELTFFSSLSSCPGKCSFKVEGGGEILEIVSKITLLPVGEVARMDGVDILEG